MGMCVRQSYCQWRCKSCKHASVAVVSQIVVDCSCNHKPDSHVLPDTHLTASPSSTVMLPVTGGGRLWPYIYVTEELLCTNANYGVKKSHRGWQLNNLFGVIALLQFSAGKWSAQPLRQPQLRSGRETRDTVRTCGRVTMHSIELTIMSKNVTKLWLRFHVSFYRIP